MKVLIFIVVIIASYIATHWKDFRIAFIDLEKEIKDQDDEILGI